MKQKPTSKYLLVVASIISLFAFIYVNVHAGFSVKKQSIETKFVQTQVEEEEEQGGRLAVPDFTVLGKLWDIAQKILDHK